VPILAAVNGGYYGRTVRFGIRGHDPAERREGTWARDGALAARG